MIILTVKNPSILWLTLGKLFFGKEYDSIIDIHLGDRRQISLGNTFTVLDWPKEWTGRALFDLVGYSPQGYKMDLLRRTYVDEDKWKAFKEAVKNSDNKFSSQGMNFNMSIERRGGCLSSLHLVRHQKKAVLFVHGKIAEIPRKFVADLLLVSELLRDLSVYPVEVRFMYSVVYFSIVGLRAYIPILGTTSVNLHNLPILTPRNYQATIIATITNFGNKFTSQERKEGIWKKIDLEKGEWKR